MLLVDNRGSDAIGQQLVHARWNGLRVADLVFPLFLLLVGVCMPVSRRAQRPRQALLRVLRLALLGWLIVTAKYGLGSVGAGVLGHIAGAYLLCWLLLRLPRRAQVPVAAGVLVAIGVLLVLVPAPGAGHPSLAPGPSPRAGSRSSPLPRGGLVARVVGGVLGFRWEGGGPRLFAAPAAPSSMGCFGGARAERREGGVRGGWSGAGAFPLVVPGQPL